MAFLIPTLSGVFKILREAFKIFFRSWKTLISIALLYSFIHYILSLSNRFISTKPFDAYFPTNQTNNIPFDHTNTTNAWDKSFEYLADQHFSLLRLYIDSMKDGKGWALGFAKSLAYSFFAVATILVSTAKHCSAIDLVIEDLLSLIAKSWKRALLTLVLKKFLDEASHLLFIAPQILSVFSKSIVAFFLSFSIPVVVFPIISFYYISVVCNLGLLISVLEKKSGFEAIAKASKLVKGSKLKVLLLSVVFHCALLLLNQLSKVVNNVELVAMALNLMVDSVLDVLWLSSLAVFYCQCKKIHGEEVEKENYTGKYSKLPFSKFQ